MLRRTSGRSEAEIRALVKSQRRILRTCHAQTAVDGGPIASGPSDVAESLMS